jgi:hypothetical protein
MRKSSRGAENQEPKMKKRKLPYNPPGDIIEEY